MEKLRNLIKEYQIRLNYFETGLLANIKDIIENYNQLISLPIKDEKEKNKIKDLYEVITNYQDNVRSLSQKYDEIKNIIGQEKELLNLFREKDPRRYYLKRIVDNQFSLND